MPAQRFEVLLFADGLLVDELLVCIAREFQVHHRQAAPLHCRAQGNWLVALSERDKGNKRFVQVDELNFSAHTVV